MVWNLFFSIDKGQPNWSEEWNMSCSSFDTLLVARGQVSGRTGVLYISRPAQFAVILLSY